jgi:hypothetical protein
MTSMNAAPACCNAAFNERLKLRLVDGEAAPNERGTEPDRHANSSIV